MSKSDRVQPVDALESHDCYKPSSLLFDGSNITIVLVVSTTRIHLANADGECFVSLPRKSDSNLILTGSVLVSGHEQLLL